MLFNRSYLLDLTTSSVFVNSMHTTTGIWRAFYVTNRCHLIRCYAIFHQRYPAATIFVFWTLVFVHLITYRRSGYLYNILKRLIKATISQSPPYRPGLDTVSSNLKVYWHLDVRLTSIPPKILVRLNDCKSCKDGSSQCIQFNCSDNRLQ